MSHVSEYDTVDKCPSLMHSITSRHEINLGGCAIQLGTALDKDYASAVHEIKVKPWIGEHLLVRGGGLPKQCRAMKQRLCLLSMSFS